MSKSKKSCKPSRVREALMAPPRVDVPRFGSEAEEREFWQEHDSADYVDWSGAKTFRLPNIQPRA
jgi:hypothetical protein